MPFNQPTKTESTISDLFCLLLQQGEGRLKIVIAMNKHLPKACIGQKFLPTPEMNTMNKIEANIAQADVCANAK